MNTASRVRAIFRGRGERAGWPKTELWLYEIEWLASALFKEAGVPSPWSAPNALAYRLGERLKPTAVLGCGGDLCTDGLIMYRPHDNPRVEGGRLYHALAHRQVRRHGEGSEADVWVLQGELVLPWRFACDMTIEEALERQPHAPRWLLEAQLEHAQAYKWVATG